MADEYRIEAVEEPEWGVIGGGVHEYNIQQAGEDHSRRICYVLREPGGEVVGGAIGIVHWEWFCLDLLFVKEELRGRGFGHRLLGMAENEARKCGAKHSYLDTFSFQAPVFYEKHGYAVFGELSEFPPGHERLYMKKDL